MERPKVIDYKIDYKFNPPEQYVKGLPGNLWMDIEFKSFRNQWDSRRYPEGLIWRMDLIDER